MTNQTIKLRKKQLAILFPNKFTKMREEDFLNKAIENKKILNEKEYNDLINIRGDKEHFEFYVRRKKDKIELVPFD